MVLQTLNLTTPAPESETSFTITTTAPTDIWHKPPQLDVFNAPLVYRALPISEFSSARLTASASWKTLFDQGGIFVLLPPKASKPDGPKRWVKAGIEFYHGKPFMSVVASDEWADWSLSSLPEGQGHVTVDIERLVEDGKRGSVLIVSVVGEDGTKTPVREVTWAFWDVEGGEQAEMWVGAFGAKPTVDGDDLLVKIDDFKIVTV